MWVATLSTDLEWLSAVQLLADTSTEVSHVRVIYDSFKARLRII